MWRINAPKDSGVDALIEEEGGSSLGWEIDLTPFPIRLI
jgi:hypothetical protein